MGLLLREGREKEGRGGKGIDPPALPLHPSHYILDKGLNKRLIGFAITLTIDLGH